MRVTTGSDPHASVNARIHSFSGKPDGNGSSKGNTGNTNNSNNAVQTGDTASVGICVVALAAAGIVGIVGAIMIGKKRKDVK